MKLETKRIFISDLPETATEDEIKTAFSDYGTVKSIEIKERKELGPKNYSLFFSYINLEIDDGQLQKCFNDFASNKWHGQYVALQVARESFLDRLKRERAENEGKSQSTSQNNNLSSKDNNKVEIKTVSQQNGLKRPIEKTKPISSDSSSDSSSSEDEVVPKKIMKKVAPVIIQAENTEESEEKFDIVIKNNKGKTVDKNCLKIESVGNKPIIKIELSKKKASVNQSAANLKRLQSVSEMKNSYKSQKQQIAAALAKVDTKSNNKTVFSDDVNNIKKQKVVNNKKKALFDEDEEDDVDFESNFAVKEQFQGTQGQKLLQLQSRYKNDKRFALDKRFLDQGQENLESENLNEEEITIEEEKKREYEILGGILGKTVGPKNAQNGFEKQNQSKKAMLRFDPSQPSHSQYEVPNTAIAEKKKKKNKDHDLLNEKRREEETEAPEVSKEVFYSVTNDLKQSLHENQQFSLLNMFGSKNEDGEKKDEEINEGVKMKNKMAEKNPFRYDSSDDEDQTTEIPNQDGFSQAAQSQKKPAKRIWSEPFFFHDDDYRLQEGFEFIERMKSEDTGQFKKIRKDLKDIVRAKVRRNLKKNKPFKKKLGGNRKKKVLRLKKALKR